MDEKNSLDNEVNSDIKSDNDAIEKSKKLKKPRSKKQIEVWERCLAKRKENNLKKKQLKEVTKSNLKRDKKVIKERVKKEMAKKIVISDSDDSNLDSVPKEIINTSSSSESSDDSQFEYIVKRNKKDYSISRNRRGKSQAKPKPQKNIVERVEPVEQPQVYYDFFV